MARVKPLSIPGGASHGGPHAVVVWGVHRGVSPAVWPVVWRAEHRCVGGSMPGGLQVPAVVVKAGDDVTRIPLDVLLVGPVLNLHSDRFIQG